MKKKNYIHLKKMKKKEKKGGGCQRAGGGHVAISRFRIANNTNFNQLPTFTIIFFLLQLSTSTNNGGGYIFRLEIADTTRKLDKISGLGLKSLLRLIK
jgi:hypothetical protein